MDRLDKDYWNDRYSQNRMGWNVGKVSTPLKVFFDGLHNKDLNILIPGAGNAYEAEYLYRKGFRNITVLDWADRALGNLLQRTPTFPSDDLVCEDFFVHEGQYDLIIEQTFFCSLPPDMRKDYVKAMHSLLVPGGELVGVLFNAPMFEDSPPFGGSEGEYKTLFELLFQIKTLELCYNSIPERAGTECFFRMVKAPAHLN